MTRFVLVRNTTPNQPYFRKSPSPSAPSPMGATLPNQMVPSPALAPSPQVAAIASRNGKWNCHSIDQYAFQFVFFANSYGAVSKQHESQYAWTNGCRSQSIECTRRTIIPREISPVDQIYWTAEKNGGTDRQRWRQILENEQTAWDPVESESTHSTGNPHEMWNCSGENGFEILFDDASCASCWLERASYEQCTVGSSQRQSTESNWQPHIATYISAMSWGPIRSRHQVSGNSILSRDIGIIFQWNFNCFVGIFRRPNSRDWELHLPNFVHPATKCRRCSKAKLHVSIINLKSNTMKHHTPAEKP